MMTSPHDDLSSLASEHNDVVRIERLTHHMLRIRESVDEMKSVMKEMASAITRLALVEERQAATSTALERLGEALTKLDERLRNLEIAEPMQTRSSEWMMNAVWAAAAAAVMFVAGRAGLF